MITEFDDRELLISAIFKSTFDFLYHYGLKITRNKALVEDCIQELFFNLWKNNIDLHAVKQMKPYLIKALRCRIINNLNLQDYNKLSDSSEYWLDVEYSEEDFIYKRQEEEIRAKKVADALNKLPLKQREAVYLRYFEELQLSEVAEIMQIKIQSVKNYLQRSYHALTRILFLFFISLVAFIEV